MTSEKNCTLDQQIQFARHNFDNYQALIRSSDTKAGVLVTIMVFLAASALQVSKDAIGKIRWTPGASAVIGTVFLLAALGLLTANIWSFLTVQRVLKPRGARHYRAPQKSRDLMWQDHVLLHQTNTEYLAAVQGASEELILQNLADQVFELAHISKEKMDALRSSRWAVYLACWSWAANIAAALFLLRSK
jgi:hypothetical protein